MTILKKYRLSPTDLAYRVPADWLDFQTTDELDPSDGIIGQERAMTAVQTGLKIRTRGYNIFAVGDAGSGKTSILKRILTAQAEQESIPEDIIYVHDFDAPDRPRPIFLPAGRGRDVAREMERLVRELKKMIPRILLEGASGHIRAGIIAETKGRADALTAQASQVAAELGLIIRESENALHVMPMYRGKPLSEEDMEKLPDTTRKRIEKKIIQFQEKAESFAYARRQLEIDHDERVRAAEIRAITPIIEERIGEVIDRYRSLGDEIVCFLENVQRHCIEHYELFTAEEHRENRPDSGSGEDGLLHFLEKEGASSSINPDILYGVNVFVDRSGQTGAPVIVERMPTASALCGGFEYRETPGGLTTDHTLLRPGALHQANGGYLLIQAQELLSHENAWASLKRALRHKEIRIDEGMGQHSAGMPKLAGALKPGSIPLQVKVVLVGSHELYYLLSMEDENFNRLFKILADFEPTMSNTRSQVIQLARFLGQVCREEGYLPVHRGGVARILEAAARKARNRNRLSTRQAGLLDLLAESDIVARESGASSIRRQDVQTAVDAREQMHGSVSTAVAREIDSGSILIRTTGEQVGQLNGIALYDVGGFAFGTPVRITARTYVGRRGVVNIDREVQLSGAIHDKGSLIMIGYIGGRYATHEPLGFSASVTFEQSYDEIDGDSASAAELFALLSSLSGCPIRQGIAVTGSVNQLGELQPIGGVNEKIEGIFKVCDRRGLTGTEGVLIPVLNVNNLMLNETVLRAVRNRKFNIWAVSSIDEGLEVLTGVRAGTRISSGAWQKGSINDRIQRRLSEFVLASRNDIQSAFQSDL
jgi:lon-related putative ATP-dependent protease